MEQDENSIKKRLIKWGFFSLKYFTISSSRFRVGSSNSALITFGSRSSSVIDECCQRCFGKYHAPYRYLSDCSS